MSSMDTVMEDGDSFFESNADATICNTSDLASAWAFSLTSDAKNTEPASSDSTSIGDYMIGASSSRLLQHNNIQSQEQQIRIFNVVFGQSSVIQGAAQAQTHDTQLPQDDVAREASFMKDRLYELPPDSRQRIINKITVTLGRRLPVSGPEGLMELKKIAVRFEEKVYTAATSQYDYLHKISLKMLTFETESQNPLYSGTLQVVDETAEVQMPNLHQKSLHSIIYKERRKRKGDTGPSGHDLTIFQLGNKQKTNKKSKKTWGFSGSVSLEDLKQHFGKKREEAAESLNVSVSTFRRICRDNGISRWPSKKIKRERLLLSNVSSNETDGVAGGANISTDNEISTSLKDNVLRNGEGTDAENVMIQEGDPADEGLLYEAQEFEPVYGSSNPAYSLPDAPLLPSRLPRERMPAKDAVQVVSSAADQQRENIARQIEMTGETSHLDKQFNCNTEKEFSVEDASTCDLIRGRLLTDCASLNQLTSTDGLESIHESTAEPSVQNDARRMKLIFEKLIMLPLEDLTNPNHEASMKEALAILSDDLSLFPEEQAKQILELKFDFPAIVYSWRDCSQSQIDCQNFLAGFEKTKSLLESSAKEEEDRKDRYRQLESMEKDLMAQLEAIRKEKNEINEETCEKINQSKHLVVLAEEQTGRAKEKELQITIASAKLNKLMKQWVSVQSSFI